MRLVLNSDMVDDLTARDKNIANEANDRDYYKEDCLLHQQFCFIFRGLLSVAPKISRLVFKVSSTRFRRTPGQVLNGVIIISQRHV